MLRNFSRIFGITALVIAMISTEAKTASAQSKSQTVSISAPATARVNSPVTVTARLTDTWTGASLPGRVLDFALGQEFWLSNRGSYNTNSNGQATAQLSFNTRGRHRIVVYMSDGYGYISQRSTVFITVN